MSPFIYRLIVENVSDTTLLNLYFKRENSFSGSIDFMMFDPNFSWRMSKVDLKKEQWLN